MQKIEISGRQRYFTEIPVDKTRSLECRFDIVNLNEVEDSERKLTTIILFSKTQIV